jgi:hypothetical protein
VDYVQKVEQIGQFTMWLIKDLMGQLRPALPIACMNFFQIQELLPDRAYVEAITIVFNHVQPAEKSQYTEISPQTSLGQQLAIWDRYSVFRGCTAAYALTLVIMDILQTPQ